MKKNITKFLFFFSLLTACTPVEEICIEVANPMGEDRSNEMVEVELKEITAGLELSEGQGFIISNAENEEVPYQITYDKKVIFNVGLKENEKINFKVRPGSPQNPEVYCCGNIYPERMEDLAWENDLVGFRAYGPALQQRGEKAFGYDLFAKRGTRKPVLEAMYAMETDKIAWSEVRALKGEDPEAAEKLRRSITYHVDKGYGMDCYAVGPTLGAGVAALVEDGDIVYPWCYKSCEILDNGPLRFTAKLVFAPMDVNDLPVIETRIIQLNKGSHLNHTWVSYSNLKDTHSIVSGMVLHDSEGRRVMSADKDFMAYEDPTTGPNQGRLYLGQVFPSGITEMKVSFFPKEEAKLRSQALGHLLAVGQLMPDQTFEYFWGFGWNRSDMIDFDSWIEYLTSFSKKLKYPLQVSMK